MERTFVMIKPDAMKKNLAGEIIKRYQEAGLRIVGIKAVFPHKELAEKHYPDHEKQIVGMGKKTIESCKERGESETLIDLFNTEDPKEIGLVLREWLITFITSHPVIAIVLEGEDAVQKVRKMTGFTDPSKAEKGTIRGDLGTDAIHIANKEKRATENLVHASGNLEEAKNEICLWFNDEEIIDYGY